MERGHISRCLAVSTDTCQEEQLADMCVATVGGCLCVRGRGCVGMGVCAALCKSNLSSSLPIWGQNAALLLVDYQLNTDNWQLPHPPVEDILQSL